MSQAMQRPVIRCGFYLTKPIHRFGCTGYGRQEFNSENYCTNRMDMSRVKSESSKRREIYLQEKEQAIKMKEKELENRERMLQCSEQRAHDLEADDIYEYLLQKKEEELNLKCMLLESRERQIKS